MKQEAEQREKVRDEAMEKAFEAGRNSVVFNPHSDYRNALRELIVDDDFDFTKIFCEVEYEGETYADLSEDGADALTDYFLGLMEVIDERRSEDAEFRPGLAAAREGEVDASGLLPCPFCGGTATSEREDEIGFVTVRCSTEGCILDNMAINPMSWNRRDK
jgi:hypothetical protein